MRTIPAPLATVALDTPALVMPDDTLPPGSTQDLRRTMARFCDGEPHATARAAVEAAIAAIDRERLCSIAARRTRALIADQRANDASALVPAAAMAETLGVIDAEDAGTGLVRRLVRVGDAIVAGTIPAGDVAPDDDATELLAMVERVGDPVALVSILHQTRGATGALIEALVDPAAPRRAAVPATKRTATTEFELDSFGTISGGETVAVELDLATEFGHGRHACPGRDLAEAIAAAIVDALVDGRGSV